VTALELEIFEQTSDYTELRLRDGHQTRTRGLPAAAVDDLVAVVENTYSQDRSPNGWSAPRSCGSCG
jgi:hypothetical protein